MANRYGRKQRRAHRAALAEIDRRAFEQARHYQRLIGGLEARIRDRDEALRLLGSGYGKHAVESVVAEAETAFMRGALEELGRHGLAAVQVGLETRPDFREGREVKVVHALIPPAEFRAVVDERFLHGR